MLEPNRPAEFTGAGTLYLSSSVFFLYAKFISFLIAENGLTKIGSVDRCETSRAQSTLIAASEDHSILGRCLIRADTCFGSHPAILASLRMPT